MRNGFGGLDGALIVGEDTGVHKLLTHGPLHAEDLMWLTPDDLPPGSLPVCTCDFCLWPITAADPGGPVLPRSIQPGRIYVVQHAHHGPCRDFLEERLAKEHSHPPTRPQDNPD
jgi:hypothetical protein